MTKTFSYLDTYRNKKTGQIFIILDNIKYEKYKHTEESFFGCKMYVKALEKTELEIYCIDMLDSAYEKIKDSDAEVICTKYRMLHKVSIKNHIVTQCRDAYDVREMGIGQTIIVYDSLKSILSHNLTVSFIEHDFHNITLLRKDSIDHYTFIAGLIKEFSTEYVLLKEFPISFTENYSSIMDRYLQELLKNHYYLEAQQTKEIIKEVKANFVLSLPSELSVIVKFKNMMKQLIKDDDMGVLCLLCLKKLSKEEIKEYLYYYLNHNKKFQQSVRYLSCYMLYKGKKVTVILNEYTKEIFESTVNGMYKEVVKILGRTGEKKSIKRCANKLRVLYWMSNRKEILDDLEENELERKRRLKDLITYC